MAIDEVAINEARIQELIKVYREAYVQILDGISNATTFGKIQRLQIMADIKQTLAQLTVDINQWVEQEIPLYYRQGANDAIKDLQNLGVELTNTKNFSSIQKQAIEALVTEVQTSFADSMTAISRSARGLLTQAQKMEITQLIAKGLVTAEDRATIVATIKDKLQQQGLTGLIDKSGRKWAFEDYLNMLVRTKVVESRNVGLGNRMAENGYDLVQVSSHNSPCSLCAPWEGKILSYTGNTPGYPTYNDAVADGLFHPNCKHAINVVVPALAAQTNAYDAPLDSGP